MKIEPDHTKVCYGVVYARELRNEYLQSAAEGKDIEKYEALFTAIDSMPLNNHKVKMADTLFELVLEAPIKEGYAYEEPSTLEEIKSCRPGERLLLKQLETANLREKIHGAWMGRICGCLLGKTVEGIHTDELIPLLRQSGNYPMHRYIRHTDVTPEMWETYAYF